MAGIHLEPPAVLHLVPDMPGNSAAAHFPQRHMLYALTRTGAYSEALELLSSKLKTAPDISAEEPLARISGREPCEGEEIRPVKPCAAPGTPVG